MKRPVFVTGGSGFIGQRVVRSLVNHGIPVRALARSATVDKILSALGAMPVRGDVRDFSSCRLGAAGCEAAIHVAGISSYRMIDRRVLYETNVEGTRNMTRLVEELKLRRFVYCSSVAALGGSIDHPLTESDKHDTLFFSAYERTKWEAHCVVRDLALRQPGVVLAMPSLVMGMGSGTLGVYIDAYLKRRLPFIVKLSNPVSFVDVTDVAAGLLACLLKGGDGEQYIFAGETSSLMALTSLLRELSGVEKPRLELSPRVAMPLIAAGEFLGTLGRIPLPLTIASLRTLNKRGWAYCDNKARVELGWRSKSLRQMTEDTLRAMGVVIKKTQNG